MKNTFKTIDFINNFKLFGDRKCKHCNKMPGAHYDDGECDSDSGLKWYDPIEIDFRVGHKVLAYIARREVQEPVQEVTILEVLKDLYLVKYGTSCWYVSKTINDAENSGFIFDLIEINVEDWYTIIARRNDKNIVILIKDKNKYFDSFSSGNGFNNNVFKVDSLIHWHSTAPTKGWQNMYNSSHLAKQELKTPIFNITLEDAELYILCGKERHNIIRVNINDSSWRI